MSTERDDCSNVPLRDLRTRPSTRPSVHLHDWIRERNGSKEIQSLFLYLSTVIYFIHSLGFQQEHSRVRQTIPLKKKKQKKEILLQTSEHSIKRCMFVFMFFCFISIIPPCYLLPLGLKWSEIRFLFLTVSLKNHYVVTLKWFLISFKWNWFVCVYINTDWVPAKLL